MVSLGIMQCGLGPEFVGAFDIWGDIISVSDFGGLVAVGFGAVPPEDVLVGVVVDAGEVGVDLE